LATWTWFHKLSSPPHFYRIAGKMLPWLAIPAALLIVGGVYGGLVAAPEDYQQGDAFRIVYVHAPSAWLSLMCYTSMAIAAAVGLIWRIKLAHAVAAATAPKLLSLLKLAKSAKAPPPPPPRMVTTPPALVATTLAAL